MHTAAVTITAVPGEGDLRWEYYRVADEEGRIEVDVASNRALRIEVKDKYDRELGAEYVSTHDAGLTPIDAHRRGVRHQTVSRANSGKPVVRSGPLPAGQRRAIAAKAPATGRSVVRVDDGRSDRRF